MQNKRKLGSEKEELAVTYLTERGAKVLVRNFYFHGGELDVVARDGEYVCFIEVKYRKSMAYGFPEEAVTPVKRKKIVQGANLFLYQNKYPADTPCRFDVISIYQEEVTWIKDAFRADGS